MTPAHHRRPMLEFLDSLSQIMFKVTNLVMLFAPVAVAASLAFTISKVGIAILASLAKLVATLFLSLFIFVTIVFVPVLFMCRIPFMGALKTLRRPAFIGFCTTSSEAALPQAMENLMRFGVPSHVVRFMMLMLMLTSKGIAAVPRASYMLLLSMVDPFGMDVAAINIILGVDAFMDMARTVVNLCGNCIAAMAVAVWEGEMDMEVAKGIKAPPSDHLFDDPESLDDERKKEAPHYV
ncbi:MAG: Sodium:dicarboxylate symporter [Olpidium bornovanus]|uniref:Amino acid transporter n=1 Tax=Olpidium bornovanus TaxID=278681 RepID=A0A8H7ZM44_9FUNG|nr:MAG: Sodium:dicarboxylate symporter [Olpidium bornovanus]